MLHDVASYCQQGTLLLVGSLPPLTRIRTTPPRFAAAGVQRGRPGAAGPVRQLALIRGSA